MKQDLITYEKWLIERYHEYASSPEYAPLFRDGLHTLESFPSFLNLRAFGLAKLYLPRLARAPIPNLSFVFIIAENIGAEDVKPMHQRDLAVIKTYALYMKAFNAEVYWPAAE